MKKKILVHIAILLILTGGFCNVYIKGLSVSSCGNQLSAFAADDTYSWESVSKDDLVTAFKYYCKSRNLAIEGSVADAVTSFTTSTFNNICNTLGIDSTALQAELKKTTGGNLGLRFLFTQTGVSAYNRIFAEFLQNNDLGVGDEVDNKVVYSGEWFQDDNGNGCYVFIQSATSSSNPTALGTQYRYSGLNVWYMTSEGTVNTSFIVNYKNVPYTVYLTGYNGVRAQVSDRNTAGSGQVIYRPNYYDGYVSIVKVNTNYYVGGYRVELSNGEIVSRGLVKLENVENEDVDVTVNTNNTTINNNYYNNNYTIIYNDGDVYYNDDDDDDEPSPTTPPGGGGGDDPGTDPDQPPVVDPTPTPDPTVPDWDIELPEMPVGNEWLLYGLEKKFPWDIPFNLMYMLSLFAADPETPHFQGTLDLKVVQWDYDIDLTPFDDIARNVRNFEFVGFIIGLMLLTRKLIWG